LQIALSLLKKTQIVLLQSTAVVLISPKNLPQAGCLVAGRADKSLGLASSHLAKGPFLVSLLA
jgi:hypothetical protein